MCAYVKICVCISDNFPLIYLRKCLKSGTCVQVRYIYIYIYICTETHCIFIIWSLCMSAGVGECAIYLYKVALQCIYVNNIWV